MDNKAILTILAISTIILDVIFSRHGISFFLISGTALFYAYTTGSSVIFYAITSVLSELNSKNNLGIGLLAFSLSALVVSLIFRFIVSDSFLSGLLRFILGFLSNYILYTSIITFREYSTIDVYSVFNLKFLFSSGISLLLYIILIVVKRSSSNSYRAKSNVYK